jgi:flavodoxin-like protein
MLMHTFAEAHDFTAKTVHPFVTHAMSGLGTAERDYRAACPGADIGEGLAVQGETVHSDGPAAAAAWLDRIHLPGRPARASD